MMYLVVVDVGVLLTFQAGRLALHFERPDQADFLRVVLGKLSGGLSIFCPDYLVLLRG